LALVATILFLSTPARAHHILGIPHYAYDEQYPQTPILTYIAQLGPLEIKMTGYPGMPQPGERCTLHVYAVDMNSGTPFDGGVTMSVFRERLLGSNTIVYGPVRANLEDDAIYKFYPEFEREANYIVRIEYETEGVPWVIDLPMVAGEPGSPWVTLGGFGGGIALFLILMRAIRIKRARYLRLHPSERPVPPREPVAS